MELRSHPSVLRDGEEITGENASKVAKGQKSLDLDCKCFNYLTSKPGTFPSSCEVFEQPAMECGSAAVPSWPCI